MMKSDYEMIKKRVKNELKSRNFINKKTIEELSQSCFDDYKLSLENGISEEESLNYAITSLNETLDSYALTTSKPNKYQFSLMLSLILFAACYFVSMLGWLSPGFLGVTRVIYPLFFLTILIIFIYTIINYKKRNKLDFVIVTINFLAVLSITIQCFSYFYRARTGDFYYSLFYVFPGVLKFNRHVLTSLELFRYEIESTVILFDPTLLVSFFSLIISVVFNMIERRKKHV